MKSIFTFFFFLLSFSIFAQDKAEIETFFWGKSDEYNKVTEVPSKWKDESAVIIYKNEYYDYHKFGTSVKYTSAIRKRIKLQDLAAVKEFSEFSFEDKFYSNKGYTSKKSTSILGVKILKPNGKEIIIDIEKEAKEIDKEKKIAISNLEVGDIIDMYFYSIEPFNSKYELGFDPEETTLGDTYPIMNLKINFKTENDFFLNFNTYNGAPELKEIKTNKGGERQYVLEAKDIEKNEFPRWFYPLAEMPCYKFQVFFARSGKFEERAYAFLSEKESVVKKTVSKEEVFEFYNDKFRPAGDLSPVEKFIKNNKFSSDEEKVREVYYFARHKFYTQFIEPLVVENQKLFSVYKYYQDDFTWYMDSQTRFINYFMKFLKENKIDYDLIVATGRENGSIDDLLIQQNLKVLLRINTPKPIYLDEFSSFSNTDIFDSNLEGTKAYVMQISKGKKIVDAVNTTLPETSANDNASKVVSNITIADDFSTIKVNREMQYLGHIKEEEQSDRVKFYDYVHEDNSKYITESLNDRIKSKKERAKYIKEYDAFISKLKEQLSEKYKKDISEEFGFEIEDYTFSTVNTGRYGTNSPLILNEGFAIKKDLIKKAGNNYIFEIGKFLTKQVEITKKEKDRKNNVYSPYPRSYENEIVFEIPSGYTASGIEKLNKKVQNETGEFISTAKIEGNKLTIKTSKKYNKYYWPNADWKKMISFLDEAYQFTQEKVLLKKK
ncbi:DUF3857 domain-containing protein [Flavobacterium sp. 5]|uniref:DUF3857 domain-containing protein n=1 Tax=Flavobacterium sp. 5 TaxID=2035199 RepID=UPI000C2C811F|nr:DUF3857 domain-containing protein [Flavobacterium sp. 5]PKB15724.1 uncharacterized protein DUF3857 [Flavobacterium sp. 5]